MSLARPISISKWERGEAPVPVHHWQLLIKVLSLDEETFLEAARKDRHRQLGFYLGVTRSLQESALDLGQFTWDFIVTTLAPESAAQLGQLRERYRQLSPAEFVKAAVLYFVEQARLGLDRNNQPILRAADAGPTEPPPHVASRKAARSARPKSKPPHHK